MIAALELGSVQNSLNLSSIFLPAEACDCGRTWDCWEMGTVSRYDDMIKMKGINVWPSAIDAVIFSCPEIDEYNGVVFLDGRGREHIRINLEFRKAVTDPEPKKRVIAHLLEELAAKIGLHIEVMEAPPGAIEHFEYRSWAYSPNHEFSLFLKHFGSRIFMP